MRARDGSAIPPCSGASSPQMTRNNVVFPAPLRPARPTRAPSGIRAEAPSISSRPARRTDRSSITSMRGLWPRAAKEAIEPAQALSLPLIDAPGSDLLEPGPIDLAGRVPRDRIDRNEQLRNEC